MKYLIKLLSGIKDVKPGFYAGIVEEVYKFPVKEDEAFVIEIKESAEAELKELKKAFPNAKFEIVEVEKQEDKKASN